MPVYKDKKTNKWFAQYNYKDANGNYRSTKSKRFDTKGEASKKLAEMMYEKKEAVSIITFDKVFSEYLEEQRTKVKPTTHMHYQALYDHIKDNLGNVVIEKLTVPRYKEFKAYLDNKVVKTIRDENGNDVDVHMSTSRKNRCHKFVKTLIRLAYDNHGIMNYVPDRVGGFVNPVEVEGDEDEEIVFLTLSEFQAFLEAFKDDIVYHTLFMVLFYQGTRIGEALALNWNDINFDEGIMRINKTYTSKVNKDYQNGTFYITKPKTRKSIRNIPIEKNTLECLKKLKEDYSEYQEFSDNWFVFGGIRPLSETSIAKRKDEAFENTGVKRITLHQFRHSCASYLFEKGAKPTAVQQYLGHSKLSTTMNIYIHLYPEDLMNIHNVD